MNRFVMIFRNTVNAIIASFAAVGSGVTAIVGELNVILGCLATIAGILAGYATYRAQMEKAKTEQLQQVRLEGHIELSDDRKDDRHFEAEIKTTGKIEDEEDES